MNEKELRNRLSKYSDRQLLELIVGELLQREDFLRKYSSAAESAYKETMALIANDPSEQR
jgi:hypothetical protein